MLNLNEEYFMEPYYFYMKDKGNKIAVYYSVSNTLAESRKQDDVIEVDKEVFKGIQELISKILKSGKKISKEQIHKLMTNHHYFNKHMCPWKCHQFCNLPFSHKLD